MKDFMKSLFGRRVLIPVAIIGLLGVFLGLYYLVYMPREQVKFNRSAFDLLAHISDNFKDRIENYSTSIVTAEIQNEYNRKVPLSAEQRVTPDLIRQARQPVIGNVDRDSLYATRKLLRNDSIVFSIRSNQRKSANDTGKTIRAILEPIIAIRNNIFESVILVSGHAHQHAEEPADKSGKRNATANSISDEVHGKTLLYSSGDLTIDQDVIIDSIVRYTGGFLLPQVKELPVEGTNFKLFLYPFRIDNHRYLIGGFLSQQDYKSKSQDFPVKYLVIIGILILLALLSLPFLKIFLIGSGENITIKDVRAVIAMLFIFPFLFVLLLSAFWIGKTEDGNSSRILRKLHSDIADNFRQEVATCLKQLHHYERLYSMQEQELLSSVQTTLDSSKTGKKDAVHTINLRDFLFFPSHYMNMDGVFWVNDKGVEVEKWNLVNIISPFLYLSERQYYKDVKSRTLDSIPVDTLDYDSGVSAKSANARLTHMRFTMQPTLSKATGNFTVNIVKPTAINFDKSRAESQAILIGISAKMYSVFKPVVPKGYNFCIINNAGDILFHSQSERSLQENLFEETGNDEAIVNAVMNRDSALVESELYQHEVKALVTPLHGVPYQLVTYYNKRNDYLFNIHIVAFTFVTESLILLALGVFILLFYYVTRKPSRLFFSPDQFDWMKPGHQKLRFYKTLIYFQLILFAVLALLVMIMPAEQRVNFIMQTSILLPFSIASGYYMFRSAESMARMRRQDLLLQAVASRAGNKPGSTSYSTNMDSRSADETAQDPNGWVKEKAFKTFASRIIKILLACWSVLLFFSVIKSNVEEKSSVTPDATVNVILSVLFICIPAVTAIAATRKYYVLTQEKRQASSKSSAYLRYLGIALMISVFMISIIPALGLLLFAYEQENALQTKSAQMHLARNVESHRMFVNQKVAAAKFHLADHFLQDKTDAYIHHLKFSRNYGLYLANHRMHHVTAIPVTETKDKHHNSVVYKQVTDYLFLPADHFDFYNNTRDYYWRSAPNGRDTFGVSTDSLTLYYTNLTDPRNSESIVISADIPHSLPLIRKLEWMEILFFFLVLAAFFFAMYTMFFSIAKRVFLIGYFEGKAVREQDPTLINSKLEEQTLNEFDRRFWVHPVLTLQIITDKENECHTSHKDYAEWVLRIQTMLAPAYEAIWRSLEPAERSVLYDFALDGFTNYRNIGVLFSLYKKSLVRKHKNHLRIMTDSFRNFLISKSGTPEIRELQRTVSEGGKWGNLRALFYIVLLAIVLFLFITREDVSKRVLTIVTALAAIIPLLLKLFDPFSPSKATDK
jgi:hypothetical protein